MRQSFKPEIRTFVSNALNNVDHDRIWSLQWAHAKGDACGELLSAAGMGAMAAVHIQYNDGEFDEVSSTKTAGSCRNHRRRRVWDLGAGGDRGWSRRTLISKFRGARAGAATLSLLQFL